MEIPTATELKAMNLPKSLYGFIAMLGMERPSLIDKQEWKQLCVLYASMRELQNDEGLEALASRLNSYLRFYQKLQVSDPRHSLPPKLAKKIQRKERNRSRRLGSTPYRPVYESSVEEKARERLAEPKIGLGIDSTLPPTKKVRRDQVRIDAHTQPLENNQSYHALYVAGWTLAPEAD
ncbi:hypothetical protein [Pseudomonas sp. Y24-6]|uniref:hypothetical protein n=1 Tax=Pseudomonas sp. Y24-6 TaxID=2750013 RepID=UPI001CE1A8FB|nr:hypothetical protein [Pseudomonas sp. Y24-6]MCA4965875.1 hypothetical protein [Pseudomonas sp. Y24-6]